jgi:hypothetical protein
VRTDRQTVRTLIEALSKLEPDLPVWADGDDRECPIGEPQVRPAQGANVNGYPYPLPRRVTL